MKMDQFRCKSVHNILPLLLFLFSCSSLPHNSLKFGCTSPGEIQSGSIEGATRGYAYSFGIYLPPCYDKSMKPGYPVIYLVPGIGGGVNVWFNQNINMIADQLILDRKIPPFILVTTESTGNKPTGEDIYLDLIPYIDNNYNTLEDRNHRSIAGSSLGGSAAYRLAFQNIDEFASVGMFGSGLINGENEQIKIWLVETSESNRPRVFINVGQQDTLMLERAQEMAKILDQFAISYDLIIEEGDHSYEYWVSNMDKYFQWVAQDW